MKKKVRSEFPLISEYKNLKNKNEFSQKTLQNNISANVYPSRHIQFLSNQYGRDMRGLEGWTPSDALTTGRRLEAKSEMSSFSDAKTSVFSRSTNKYESKGSREGQLTTGRGLAKKELGRMLKCKKFLQSLKDLSQSIQTSSSKPSLSSIFHPNREINDLICAIMKLKSNDPEHIEVSRVLRKALVNRASLESSRQRGITRSEEFQENQVIRPKRAKKEGQREQREACQNQKELVDEKNSTA